MAGIDSYVTLLIHSNTTEGSTTFVDSSPVPADHVFAPNGGVCHTTAQYKFGTSSIYFDGVDNQLLVADSGSPNTDFQFGTGDFTIDFWVRPYVTGATRRLLEIGNSGDNFIVMLAGGQVAYYGPTTAGGVLYTDGPTMSAGTWYHIELSRASGTTRMFVNGTPYASQADSNNYSSTGPLAWGRTSSPTGSFSGYMDEIRVSKGIARHTSAFTPPTEAYSLDPITIDVDFVAYAPEFSGSSPGGITDIDVAFTAYAPKIEATASCPIAIWGDFVAPMAIVSADFGSMTDFISYAPIISSVVTNPISINVDYKPPKADISATAESVNSISVDYQSYSPVVSGTVGFGNVINVSFIPKKPIINSMASNTISISCNYLPKKPKVRSSFALSRNYNTVDFGFLETELITIDSSYSSYRPIISSVVA